MPLKLSSQPKLHSTKPKSVHVRYKTVRIWSNVWIYKTSSWIKYLILLTIFFQRIKITNFHYSIVGNCSVMLRTTIRVTWGTKQLNGTALELDFTRLNFVVMTSDCMFVSVLPYTWWFSYSMGLFLLFLGSAHGRYMITSTPYPLPSIKQQNSITNTRTIHNRTVL